MTPTPEVPDAASALPPERGVEARAGSAAGAAGGSMSPHGGSGSPLGGAPGSPLGGSPGSPLGGASGSALGGGVGGETANAHGRGPTGPHARLILGVLLGVLLALVATVSALLPYRGDGGSTALRSGQRTASTSAPTSSPTGSPTSPSNDRINRAGAGSTENGPAARRPASAARAAPNSATLRRADARPERVRALTTLLAARRRAVLRHDQVAWLATVDGASPGFRRRQADVFENLRDVPFADWSYRYVGPAPALPAARARQLGGGAWVARVLVGHRLQGFDTATSYSEQFLTLVRRRSGWLLAADNDGSGAPQPWDLGKVRVVRGARVLVLGTGSPADLRTYALGADRAVADVTAVWGTAWPRRAVVVVPRTQVEFGRLLLRDRDGLSQVAAVTTGDLSDDEVESGTPEPTRGATPGSGTKSRRAAPDPQPAAASQVLRRNDRVVLNPGAFDRLGPTGRRVVLTHEMTHVAVRSSTTAAVPIWLSEGLADYVAYKDSGVPLRTAAADVLGPVSRGQGPKSLPTTADFDPTRTSIAPAYSASMLACALVVERYGEPALVKLYRVAATRSAGTADAPDARLTRAFSRVLSTTAPRFTADWRRYLVRLAG